MQTDQEDKQDLLLLLTLTLAAVDDGLHKVRSAFITERKSVFKSTFK
jgi:hypothetical protein